MGYSTVNYNKLAEKYGKPKNRERKTYHTSISDQFETCCTKIIIGKKNFTQRQWDEYKQWKKSTKKQKLKKKKVRNKKTVFKKDFDYNELLKDERWKKKRKEVLDRKGYVCSKCLSTDNLEVHHLSYQYGKMPWEYPISNFIVLCRKCHEEIHNINN